MCGDVAVCVSVTLMFCTQTTESIIVRPSPDYSPAILVFPHQIWTLARGDLWWMWSIAVLVNARLGLWLTLGQGIMGYVISWPARVGTAIASMRVVCPSVCHMQKPLKLSELDLRLLQIGNSDMLSDLELEVEFQHFGYFFCGSVIIPSHRHYTLLFVRVAQIVFICDPS